MSSEDEVTKPLKNKRFYDSSDPSGTAKGTKPDKPLVSTANDDFLVDLNVTFLTPDLRFVVQHWPALSEGDQRAILAIVRRVLGKSQGSN